MINVVSPPKQTNPQSRSCAILAQIAHARSQVYRWLALGFYPPDEKLVNALNSRQVVSEIAKATVWLGQEQRRLQNSLVRVDGQSTCGLGDLSQEFSRLFCKSAERISMRESTYRWRPVSSVLETGDDVTRSLRQQYEQFGVVPVQDQEDTLAVELEFMAFLCERESDEWAHQSSEIARQRRRQERDFLNDHLARWFPEFFWRVRNQAQDSFYYPLTQLTDAWLKLEHGPGYTSVR